MPVSETARFERCLTEVLHHEGGWANHPRDPGGATMKGVTQRVYDSFRDKTGKPRQSVRHIEDGELRTLYRLGYWLAAGCDGLPAGPDLMVFDLAVNSGVKRAALFLQEAVGAKADGKVGPMTLAAARAVPPADLVKRLRDRRERFYRALPTFDTFGKGWMRRLTAVNAKASEWARAR